MISHIEKMRRLYANNRRQIQALAGWDDLAYCYIQYEMGLRYMRDVLMLSPHDFAQMEKRALYWRWWVNEWNRHDHEIVMPAANQVTGNFPKWYLGTHTPRFLAAHPSFKIREQTYAEMIGQLNDKKEDI